MADNIHDAIRAFLQQVEIIPLTGSREDGEVFFNKAGVVPFMRQDGLHYYVMKPRSTVPTLGKPPFQLCKGTRMHFVEGIGWRDMQGDSGTGERETLVETAMREGNEELGLKLENIERLYDLGAYDFASATTGRPKRMWMYAAQMRDSDDFLHEREVALTTEERAWLTLEEFAVAAREDHAQILKDIEERLKNSLPLKGGA